MGHGLDQIEDWQRRYFGMKSVGKGSEISRRMVFKLPRLFIRNGGTIQCRGYFELKFIGWSYEGQYSSSPIDRRLAENGESGKGWKKE